MEQFPPSGSELGGGVPIPASSHIILLYDGFTASFNTPEWEHRHPTLSSAFEIVPCTPVSDTPGWQLAEPVQNVDGEGASYYFTHAGFVKARNCSQ